MFLSTELVKNATFLERMQHMDSLSSRFCGKTCEVWGLSSKYFPGKFMPENTDGYLCFMGISPEKLKTSYGHVHFIEFGHEPLPETEYEDDVGLLDHMCLIYGEKISREEHDSDENIVYVYPKVIKEQDVDYWLEIAENNWGIKDRNGLNEFIEDNELEDHVDWQMLYDNLPKIYYPSERVYSDYESESESEIEEGEIISDDESENYSETETETDSDSDSETSTDIEPPSKRRKYVDYSDTESEIDET
jgi:hypothetical protein